jgi:cytochrome c oxidase subunit 2
VNSWFKYIRRAVGAVLLAFVGAGCSGGLATLGTASPTARGTTDLFYFVFWFAVAVFVITEGILVYSVFRFRRKDANEFPTQIHGSNPLEVGWTLAPAIIVIVLFVFTVRTMNTIADFPPGNLTVKVTGHQWWWEFEYVELGIVTANELHIPVGQTVNIKLETADVIHSFWIPRLSGKTDLVPGRTNTMVLRADQADKYYGQCAEFCGVNHANMRLAAIAQNQADFDAWVTQMKTPPADVVGDAAKGKAVFESGACVGCHTIQGTKGAGKVGPNLTHFGSRSTLAAGVLENKPENVAKWLKDPHAIKPEAVMPNLGLKDEDISVLVAYLESLK